MTIAAAPPRINIQSILGGATPGVGAGVGNVLKALRGEKFQLPTEVEQPKVTNEIKQALSKKWSL